MNDLPPLPRTRGHKKRERTRAALLDAGVRLIARKGEGLTISDVVAEAEVSNGTFYNYFSDLEIFTEGLVGYVASRLPGPSIPKIEGEDVARRFARVCATTLAQAARDPDWGWALLRFETLRPDQQSFVLAGLRAGLARGHAAGRVAFGDEDAAPELVCAMILRTVQRVVSGAVGTDDVVDAIAFMLSALGLERAEAREIAAGGVTAAELVLPRPAAGSAA